MFTCICYLQAATYYIGTNGSDNRSGTSESQAWATFSHAISRMSAGDVLIVLDGTYYQSLSVSKSGTASYPIIIRAKNDGKINIDGQFQRSTVSISGSYIIIEGIVARRSTSTVIGISGSHNIIRRCSAYDTNGSNKHVYLVTGDYNLIEDCVASGRGRYMFLIFHRETTGYHHNVLRRCFAKWSIYDGTGPRACYSLYGAQNNILENCIGLNVYPIGSGDGVHYAAFQTVGTGNSAARDNNFYGCIFYENYHGGSRIGDAGSGKGGNNSIYENCIFMNNDGSNSLGGFSTNASSIKLKNCSFINNTNGIQGNEGDVTVINSIFMNNKKAFSKNNVTHSYCNFYNNNSIGVGLTTGDRQQNPGFYSKGGNTTYLYLPENSPLKGAGQNGEDIGANIFYRYENGVLTNQLLWPWPMQERILNEIGYDVTGTLFPSLSETDPNTVKIQLNASSLSGEAPLVVNFTSNVNGGTAPYSYSWDFGDGNNSSEQNPTHTYNSTGSFTTVLTVTDNNGEQAINSLTINVTDPDQALSVSEIKFTEVGQTQALTQLQKDKWYDLYIYFNTPNRWSEIAYADIWLNNSSYTEGTIANRGGPYYPDKNYIISFSISSDRIWVRESEGTQEWTNMTGKIGRYVKDDNNEYGVNGSEGWAKGRIKLLSNADPGNWSINAYVKNSDGNKSTLYSENFYCHNYVTEVELASFEAEAKDGEVLLTWQTTKDTNIIGFEIERSFDKKQFKKIGYVSDHDLVPKNYQFLDRTVKKGNTYFYRLKQLNVDSTTEYSSIVEISIGAPHQFNLHQNYPNPFNPSTEICYTIPYVTDVHLDIFNELGRHIMTLVKERQSSGRNVIQWDGRNENGEEVSSGLYFYRLKAGNFFAMKKMLLLR